MRLANVALGGAILLCASCYATNPVTTEGGGYGPSGGEQELSLSAALSRMDPDYEGAEASTNLTVLAVAGFHLSDNHEVGGQVLGMWSKPGGDSHDTVATGLLPYYRFNIRTSELMWIYFGPHAGLYSWDSGGESDSSLSYGGHTGVKFWMTPSTSFFVEPRFTLYEDVTLAQLLVGLTVAL